MGNNWVMTKHLVVAISGPIAGGKSALSERLEHRFGGLRLSTRKLLEQDAGFVGPPTRGLLQKFGTTLDNQTGGQWVAEKISSLVTDASPYLVIVDSVRIREQIECLRNRYGGEIRHVHVTASRETRGQRYAQRKRTDGRDHVSFDEALADPTERQVDDLASLADFVIETDRDSPEDVVIRVAARLGLFDLGHASCVDVIIGGAYGSEGKGNIAFHLAPEYDLLVRVGGPNSAHKVYLPSGRIYTHFSLPSGTLAGKATVALGPGSLILPSELQREIEECGLTRERLFIDPQVMVIEESDREAENELKLAISSTGSGTGSSTARRIMRGNDVRFARDLPQFQEYIRPTYELLEHAYASRQRILLEGTQGSGLSLHHGQYPYVTSRDTNVAGCLAEAGIAPARVRKVILVMRSYPIRVAGNSGPLVKELSWEEIEKRSGLAGLAETEKTSRTNNLRRVGEREWDLIRRAAFHNAPTDIALTFADYIDMNNREAWRFDQLTGETIMLIDEMERVTGARVSLIATGFMAHRGIIDRRLW